MIPSTPPIHSTCVWAGDAITLNIDTITNDDVIAGRDVDTTNDAITGDDAIGSSYLQGKDRVPSPSRNPQRKRAERKLRLFFAEPLSLLLYERREEKRRR